MNQKIVCEIHETHYIFKVQTAVLSNWSSAWSFEVKNLSLIFQKIVEHLEKSCDQRAKKKWTYTFFPHGHYYHVIYTSLQDSHDPEGPRSRRRKNQVKSALYSNFWRCNCCLANANGKNRRRWPLLKTISRGKSASREDWGPHRKTLSAIQEFFAMVRSPSFFSWEIAMYPNENSSIEKGSEISRGICGISVWRPIVTGDQIGISFTWCTKHDDG